jgi:phage terminase large subunit-like protein
LANFPNAAHDEDPDCFTQAIAYLARGEGSGLEGCLG